MIPLRVIPVDSVRRVALAALVSLVLLGAGPAFAHGATVRLSYGRVSPPQIAIHAGEVVHFENASATPRTFTVKGDEGSFESPPLGRGEDWHHKFPKAGEYKFTVAEFPEMQGEVVVVAPNGD